MRGRPWKLIKSMVLGVGSCFSGGFLGGVWGLFSFSILFNHRSF